MAISRHPLTKADPISAYSRYFSFHFVHTFLRERPKIYHFIGGIKYYASKSDGGIAGNYYAGLWDFEDMSFLLHFLRQNDVFIDVGANVGAYSLLAAGVCHSKTIAIEPIPSTFQRLSANIRLNALEPLVQCLNVGAGDQKTRLNFIETQSSQMNRVATAVEPGGSRLLPLTVLPLDDVVSAETMPSLLKIDVEGYEMQVLNGAAACLKHPRLKAIIVELNGSGEKYGFSDNLVCSALMDSGFQPYRYDPFRRELALSSGSQAHGFNSLFVRDLTSVDARVKTAPTFEIRSRVI